jgi:hypothetical protein
MLFKIGIHPGLVDSAQRMGSLQFEHPRARTRRPGPSPAMERYEPARLRGAWLVVSRSISCLYATADA